MNVSIELIRGTLFWGGFRVWQRNRDAFLRAWKVEVGGIAIEPFIMLVAIGFGLGAYINNVDGRSYAQFLAPGIIAGYAMFHSSFDSTYGAYLRMETHNIYEAILFTPLGPANIVLGEVMWGATRAVMSSTAVLVVASVFGLVDSPWAILTIPAAYLIGLMIASIAMIMTATSTTIGAMNNFFTLFIMPMFWMSGIFFPLDKLPDFAKAAAWLLPLTPSVALVRGLVAGDISLLMLVWVAEMIAFALVGLILASLLMKRRLIK